MQRADNALRISRVATMLTTAAVLISFLNGCAKTVAPEPNVVQRMEGESPTHEIVPTGFLGKDAALLQPGKEGQVAMVYLNPSAQWTKYNKILLENVEFWDSGDSGVSPTDQHMLTAYFYNKLKEDLQKHFTIVDQGGPDVMILQVALVSASGATPVLRSVSVVVPQARILNGIQSLGTGSYAFVGSAQAEMKATDSETGQTLAAAADKREGGMAITNAAQWKWGDAESIMDYWAELITKRLLEAQGKNVATN